MEAWAAARPRGPTARGPSGDGWPGRSGSGRDAANACGPWRRGGSNQCAWYHVPRTS